jgi:hypothetical protein
VIAGIVVGCITLALLLSTLTFCLVRRYQQQTVATRATAPPQSRSKPRLSLGRRSLYGASLSRPLLTLSRLLYLFSVVAGEERNPKPFVLLLDVPKS